MTDIRLTLNAEMRRAYREGRKTQSRKPGHFDIIDNDNIDLTGAVPEIRGKYHFLRLANGDEFGGSIKSPFGVPGDTLLLLEPFALLSKFDSYKPSSINIPLDTPILYKDDKKMSRHILVDKIYWPNDFGKWRSSVAMPNWAVRRRETVKRVWVEQIQNISIADIYAEGCPALASDWDASELYEWFADEIWDPIYKPRGLGWDSNCWNWCLDWGKERPE